MKSITLGSLFDGSGGFPLAGTHAGITPVWAAEIEPYPIAVSSLHFPQMKHLGDVSQIDGETITPVDIITFGSPCQDISIAGKREGIKHKDKGDNETTRSGLFYEAIRIIKEMRETTHGKYPKYAVWENVYGAFSSNKGEDFRCVLEEFTRICDEKSSIPRPANGKWRNAGEIVGDNFSIAWRLFDAQYWGVPQRRKRIYLVADFTGKCAGKILFERESMRGNSPACRTQGQETATDTTGSVRGSHSIECLNPWDAQSPRLYAPNGVFAALRANSGGGGRQEGVILPQNSNDNKIYALQGNTIDHPAVCYDVRGNGNGTLCPTLTGDHQNRITDYTAVAVYRNPKIGEYAADATTSTMAARDFKSPRDLVAKCHPVYGVDCRNATLDEEKTHTLQAKANGGQSLNCIPSVLTSGTPPRKYIIRRLTPLECCRLQGFPDGWGDLPEKENMTDEEFAFWQTVRDIYARVNGKTTKSYTSSALLKWYNKLHTDSAEYKMWGNGIALPCAKFIMEGIAELCKED